MGYLRGFKETIEKIRGKSAFDSVLASKQKWCFFCSDDTVLTGVLSRNEKFEVFVETEDGELEIKKLMIEFMVPAALRTKLEDMLETDEDVRALKVEPTEDRGERHHIKNRTLYPMVVDKEKIVLTFISGKKLSGQLTTFTTFELLITIAPKFPVVILRHAIHHAFNAKGVNLLKDYQQEEKTWQKSRLWIEGHPPSKEQLAPKKKKKKPFRKKNQDKPATGQPA